MKPHQLKAFRENITASVEFLRKLAKTEHRYAHEERDLSGDPIREAQAICKAYATEKVLLRASHVLQEFVDDAEPDQKAIWKRVEAECDGALAHTTCSGAFLFGSDAVDDEADMGGEDESYRATVRLCALVNESVEDAFAEASEAAMDAAEESA